MSETGPSPTYLPPLPDGRQSETAVAVQRGAGRMLRQLGFAVLTEFTLSSGRRADIIGLKGDGTIWIVEIKSSLEDFRADNKWPEYRAWCDQLFFAIPMTLEQTLMPADAGLIVADQYGAEVLRHPDPHPLVGARRKSLTLAFARLAAHRLHGLWDP